MAASTITPLFESKPSISTSSALSVCSRSSCPPTMLEPRVLPRASSSSMKMMQGALASACWNMSRTRAAPTPTNISTKSEPDRLKNGTPASPAMALASSVLPVPGGPTSSTPLGMRPPRTWYFSGVREELDHFAQLFDRFVDAGHVVERDAQVFLGVHLAAAAAEGHRRAGPAQAAHHVEEEHHAQRRSARASGCTTSRRWDRRSCRTRMCFSSSSCASRLSIGFRLV